MIVYSIAQFDWHCPIQIFQTTHAVVHAARLYHKSIDDRRTLRINNFAKIK